MECRETGITARIHLKIVKVDKEGSCINYNAAIAIDANRGQVLSRYILHMINYCSAEISIIDLRCLKCGVLNLFEGWPDG